MLKVFSIKFGKNKSLLIYANGITQARDILKQYQLKNPKRKFKEELKQVKDKKSIDKMMKDYKSLKCKTEEEFIQKEYDLINSVSLF